MSFDAIVQALDGKKEGRGFRCRCPVHQGKSLIVDEKNGKILVNCQQGCTQEDVIQALTELGLWESSGAVEDGVRIAPPPASKRGSLTAPPVLEAEHIYYVGAGEVLALKKRIKTDDGKRFEWWRPKAQRAGLGGLKVSEMPLYNAHLLPVEPEAVVYIVEGEKSADCAIEKGLLALSPAGGAAQTGFGKSLDPLVDRDVVLWPDNDGPGRTLMQRLRQALEGVASRVRTITPDLPEHGDAFDFFANGGTPEHLQELLAAVHEKAWVEQSETGITVGIPDQGGYIRFAFENITEKLHEIWADVTVQQEIPGLTERSFTARLNVLSLSGKVQFRRELGEVFERAVKGEWAGLVNDACEMVRKTYEETDRSIVLRDAPEDLGTGHILHPFVLAHGPMILFGMGGSGKSFIALRIVLAVARGETLFGVKATQANVLYVDYEASADELRRRLEAIATGLGVDVPARIHYWDGEGIPLATQVPALLKAIKKYSLGFMVVDSVAEACGGPPEKTEFAIPYMAGLSQLKIPSISVAHVTKEGGNKYPFGSVHWHNKARSTWNVQSVQEQGSKEIHCGLFHRKSNDFRLSPPYSVRVEFESTADVLRQVTFERESIIPDFAKEVSLSQRIRGALKDHGKSVKELAKELAAKEDLIRARLNSMKDAQKLSKHSDGSWMWGLSATLDSS